jgi:aspartate carbamoyltransferase regulatory subunit
MYISSFSVFFMVHVPEIILIPKVYNSQCLANHALLVKSIVQTISKKKQKLTCKFLTVLLKYNKLNNYQV